MGFSPINRTQLQLFCQRTDWGLELTGFGRPFGLGFDTQGRLLVSDMDCHVLVRWDLGQQSYECHRGVSQLWGPVQQAFEGCSSVRPRQQPLGWNGPHSAACDASGALIVTCYYSPAVVRVPSDGAATLLIGPGILRGPASTTIDSQGRLLVAEYAKNLVMVFDASGGYLGRIGRGAGGEPLRLDPSDSAAPACALAGGFDRPHMVIAASDGCLLVADTWNNRIQKFSASGDYLCLQDDLTGSKAAPQRKFWKNVCAVQSAISCPVALDQDVDGRVLVTAWGSSQLFLLESDGCGAKLPVPPTLCKPYDARFYRNGVVVADTHHGRVLIIDNLFNR